VAFDFLGILCLSQCVHFNYRLHSSNEFVRSKLRAGSDRQLQYCLSISRYALLGEPVVRERLIGAAIITTGVAVIGASRNKSIPFPKGKKLAIAIISLVLATFFWGLTGIFDKRAILIGHPFEVALAQGICDLVLIVGLFCYHFKTEGISLRLTNAETW